VRKSAKQGEGGIENEGVRGWMNVDFWGVLEVAVNKEVREILEWAGEWWDAGRRTGSVALTANPSSQRFRRLSRILLSP
jgi:hypothetical protein